MKIGFVGLGIMGSRMAANLQRAGFDLVLHNRTQAKAEGLLARGATWAETPAVAAGQVTTLITMLGDPLAVKAMAQGGDGFLDALPEGALWMDCSTVNPSFARAMAAAAADRSVRFVDAPVAGTKGPAADGTLLFLVGGDESDVADCQPFFDVMGRGVVHVGSVGMGASAKVVVNALLAQAMLVFSEGVALGEALGIPRARLLEMLLGGPVVAPVVQLKEPRFSSGDYDPDFPLRWMHKDLQLATQTGYEAGVPMPAANTAKEVYAQAVQAGLGDLDFSAIFKHLTGGDEHKLET